MIKRITGTLLLFQIINCAIAADIPIYDIGKENLDLQNFPVGLIVDVSRAQNINDISRITDFQLTNSRFVIPSIEFNYWFVFKVRNNSRQTISRIIGFDEVFMETADIYYKSDSIWHYEKNGLLQPIDQRKVKNRCPVFHVTFLPGETKTIYFKMHSKFTNIFGLFVKDVPEFVQDEQTKIIGYWAYFGAAIAILLYNIFLLYNIRESVYLYYVIYAIGIIIFTSLYSGYSLYFNYSLSLHYDLHISIAVMGIFMTLFTREILKSKEISRWIDQGLKVVILGDFLIGIMILIDISYFQWLVIFSMPSMIFLLYVGIYFFYLKVPLSKFYVIAMSGYIIGLFMIAAVSLGLIPFNTITRYGFLFGSFIELSVFSLALGYRIKILQEEKINFQDQLLAKEISMKEDLEVQVATRTEELSASNHSKDKFFSIIAHDLRGPFSSVVGLLKIIKNDYNTLTDKERIHMLTAVCNSSERTFELIENLLIWSKIQINNTVFSPQAVNLSTVIHGNVLLLQGLSDKKNIDIKTQIDTVQNVLADLEMTNTILRNLISNAIKFTPDNGQILISALLFDKDEKMIKISIKDTGVGMSTEIIKNIFSISKNTSTPGTNNENGTGLGLILCKDFVEMHEGEIWIESQLGIGSTFHFTLPIGK